MEPTHVLGASRDYVEYLKNELSGGLAGRIGSNLGPTVPAGLDILKS